VSQDTDSQETREWEDSLDDVIKHAGRGRAAFLIEQLSRHASDQGVRMPSSVTTPYRNTIPPEAEQPMPGDLFMERRIRSLIRWNALAMVMRANARDSSLGGHISSFASSATLYDVGLNHFFRGWDDGLGDLVFYQGHSSPGIYARSYLEGRLTQEQMDNFRREVDGKGLSSYPHPWLMPEYWQFPTVSMGLGPIQAIYLAHIMKYQQKRGLVDNKDRKVWAFLGDGETDEPESLGAISLAGREQLDNLIFVVNCNLQRLDGPVRGNGKIIQELEGVFRGAGWNVIKVVWGRHWDPIFAKDTEGRLQKLLDECVDGEYQNFKSNGGGYVREHLFKKDPEVLKLVEKLSDDDITRLNRGGHDPYKVYAAYHEATHHKGQPTVILAKTIKGYGMGSAGQAVMDTHNLKKVDLDGLKGFRDRFSLPISDDEIADVPYYRPPEDSPEMKYLRERRKALGGYIPVRHAQAEKLKAPDLDAFSKQLEDSGKREISSTMSFVRVLSSLVKDEAIGKRIVPIVPDEARTFGMEGMFRQLGIYSSVGQKYTPVDAGQIMYYKESEDGQVLEEGINEAGAFSSWLGLATSYSHSKVSMIPFYIFYSMFGFQRIGDLAWAAGDIQARGFLIGATAGRTTLNGEGLQHQDGHSHLVASTIPNCRSYDPAFGYELAVIIQDGIRRMYEAGESCFYYITTMNENYHHPALPEGAEEGIIKGMYKLEESESKAELRVQLLGAGTILNEARAAKELLEKDWDVSADVWSVTSVNELFREGKSVERWNMLHPEKERRQSYIGKMLAPADAPVILATDYLHAYGEQLRPFVPGNYRVLGTDGFGRSDTREKLRWFFEVDRHYIVVAALTTLADEGKLERSVITKAMTQYGIDPEKPDPVAL
jgi:pyruvate dehydrogenase E1 component